MNTPAIDQFFFPPRPVFTEYNGKTIRFETPELSGPRVGVIEVAGRPGWDDKVSLTIVEVPIFTESPYTMRRFTWQLREGEAGCIFPLPNGEADYEIRA